MTRSCSKCHLPWPADEFIRGHNRCRSCRAEERRGRNVDPARAFTVYAIVRASDDLILYVGSTRQLLHNRMRQHRSDVGRSRDDTPFRRWCLEDPGRLDGCKVVALETAPDQLRARAVEAETIEGLKRVGVQLLNESIPEGENGYRLTARRLRRRAIRPESRENYRRAQDGTPRESVPVLCVNNGVTYPSQQEAARVLGLNARTISRVSRGLSSSVDGYRFERVAA